MCTCLVVKVLAIAEVAYHNLAGAVNAITAQAVDMLSISQEARHAHLHNLVAENYNIGEIATNGKTGAFVLPRGWDAIKGRECFVLVDLNLLLVEADHAINVADALRGVVDLARGLLVEHVLAIITPARARLAFACEAQLFSSLADAFDFHRIVITLGSVPHWGDTSFVTLLLVSRFGTFFPADLSSNKLGLSFH
jgi:hypothetical protein